MRQICEQWSAENNLILGEQVNHQAFPVKSRAKAGGPYRNFTTIKSNLPPLNPANRKRRNQSTCFSIGNSGTMAFPVTKAACNNRYTLNTPLKLPVLHLERSTPTLWIGVGFRLLQAAPLAVIFASQLGDGYHATALMPQGYSPSLSYQSW